MSWSGRRAESGRSVQKVCPWPPVPTERAGELPPAASSGSQSQTGGTWSSARRSLDILSAVGAVGPVVDKGWLASHAASDDIAEVLHCDPDGKVLSVEDPQLVFYLRNLDWQAFPRALGFDNVESEHAHDFALSLAGEGRPRADALYEILDADGPVVFYDLNEQARIVGESVAELVPRTDLPIR